MSYYTFVQPSTTLLRPHCKHVDATCCLGLNVFTNDKSPFSLPSCFPQSSGDSFHSFNSFFHSVILPYRQAWPSNMSFNFSNFGNSASSQLSNSTSHSFTPSPNPLSSSSLPSHPSGTFSPLSADSRSPNIDPNLDNTVPTHFIDALANQFNFGDQEQDLRQSLHGFAKVFV